MRHPAPQGSLHRVRAPTQGNEGVGLAPGRGAGGKIGPLIVCSCTAHKISAFHLRSQAVRWFSGFRVGVFFWARKSLRCCDRGGVS